MRCGSFLRLAFSAALLRFPLSLEVVTLLERGEMAASLGYVIASLILCVGLAFVGMSLTRAVLPA